jgi:CRP-like cAMP-binding protein
MDEVVRALEKCPLFCDIGTRDLPALLGCLLAKNSSFERNSFIFLAGEDVSSVGIVLSGGVHILQEDFWGKRTILARIEPGELFGEAFYCAGIEKLPVSALAAERSEILTVNIIRALSPCSPSCGFHLRLITNLVRVLAMKNVMLTRKIGHITRMTIREKLMSYLSSRASQENSASFGIPFSRQELADYLSVDRSAMSSELGRMRDEGILRLKGRRFELLGDGARAKR